MLVGLTTAGRKQMTRDPRCTDDIAGDQSLDELGDDLSREILAAAAGSVVTARAIHESLDVSLTTVYRHVNGLVEAGLLEEVTDVRDLGSSQTGYRTTVRAILVSIGGDGVSVETCSDSSLDLAVSALLNRVELAEATFDFTDGALSVTLDVDEETLEEIKEAYERHTTRS